MKTSFFTVIGMIAVLLLGLGSCKSRGSSNAQSTQAVDAAHNSRNSLDWDGLYKGLIPCANCEGISVQLTLKSDETYRITYQYQGKDAADVSESGKFKWDAAGSVIMLDTKNFPPHYKVGENRLIQLDMEGKAITGEHADMYVLEKSE